MRWLIGLGILVVLGMSVGGCYVSYSNKEIGLRRQFEAQEVSNTAFYDKMWKTIAQKANVSEQYAENFKEVYPLLMEGRYGNERGGALLSFITESNPEFKIELYADLSREIEAQRMGFFREQQKLIDIKREHHALLTTFPSDLFIGHRDTLEMVIVTSDKTEEVFNTGKDNDIKLFDKE